MWKKIGLILALLLLYANADAAVRTTLHNAATADADGTNMTVDDKGAAGVTVTGTFEATLNFEGSADGAVTFSAVTCTEITTLVSSSTTTTAGQYQCPVAGLSHFRARISDYLSGSITAIGTASSGSLGSVGVGGVTVDVNATATATEAAPALSEGQTTAPLSLNLSAGLRVILENLLAGENLDANLMMIGGGATQVTQILGTGGVPSTATDGTSSTSILPSGMKVFQGVVLCESPGPCIQTQKIYGTWINAITTGQSVLVCTLTISGYSGSGATAGATDWCATDRSFSFWFVVTSLTGGTTPLSAVFVQY